MPRYAIQPSGYDRQLTIQVKRTTRSPIGEEIVTWVPFVVDIWAKVLPLRGKEFFAGGQMQGTVDHLVEINYRSGLTREEHRLVLSDGQPLDIVSIEEKGYREALEIMCLSGVRNGR